MDKTIARAVYAFDGSGALVSLQPGDVITDETLIANITNPAAWADEEEEDEVFDFTGNGEDELEPKTWKDFTVQDLRSIASKNKVDLAGAHKKDEVIDRLVEADVPVPQE